MNAVAHPPDLTVYAISAFTLLILGEPGPDPLRQIGCTTQWDGRQRLFAQALRI